MSGMFLYFGYGSNMLGRRLLERTPSAVCTGIGYVSGRRLTFDMASADGSGKCDIEPTDDRADRAYGVLYEIALDEKPILDRAESLGVGYREECVAVVTSDGEVEASAYVALVTDRALRPYHWYRQIVIDGAVEHGLPDGYVDRLRAHVSKPDPDEDRRLLHESLLRGV